MLLALNRNKEALDCFEKALTVNPNYLLAAHNKGHVLSNLGRHQEAIACFDQVIAKEPNFAKSWWGKGFSLDKLGQNREAAMCYRKYVEMPPPLDEKSLAHARQRLWELGFT